MAKVSTKTARKHLTSDNRKASSGKPKRTVKTAGKRKTPVGVSPLKAAPVEAAEKKRKNRKTTTIRKTAVSKPAAAPAKKTASIGKKRPVHGDKPRRTVSAAKPEKVSAKQIDRAEKETRSAAVYHTPARLEQPEARLETGEETLYSLSDSPEESPDVSDPDYEDDTSVGKKDSLKLYIQSISSFPRITVEDEFKLAEMIHSTDDELKAAAINTLINANLRLVVKIAHDFKGIGLPLPDLISEGNIGLMRSVEKFNPALGAKFSSYAAWWIKQSMHRALSNQPKLIRIPVQSGAKMRKIRKAREALKLELGREPEISEIARALNYSERTVRTLCNAENSVFSLNDPIQSDENDTFEELIADPNAKSPETLAGDRDSLMRVREALKLLDRRERQVISMRFFQGKTLEEVSVLIKRTRERVRQIQNQALSKMRAALTDEAAVVNS